MSYTVTLHDFPDIPPPVRQQAERRFARALESALGGADEVPGAWRAWQAAEDTTADEMSADDIALAKRWLRASERAHQAGFGGLGEAPEAYFEVRLDS